MRSTGLVLITLSAFLCCSAVAADAPERNAAPFPKVGPYRVLRCDFHVHTPYSDGHLTPVQRVEEAWARGYDAIAITDHGNFKAYEEALPRAKKLGLTLIRGMETGIGKGEHLVALNFDGDYKPRDSHKWATEPNKDTVFYQDQWPLLAEEAGAFMIYAHPHMGLREPMAWGLEKGFVQGIEVKNGVVGKGWNTVQSHGTWLYPQALDWAIKYNLTVFANSDVHESRNDTNSPVTLVLATRCSPNSIMKALKDGRTVAWFDGMLWGKEEVIGPMMNSLVAVQKAQNGVTLKNLSPVNLTASVDGKAIELKSNDSVAVENAGQNSVDIQWNNIWVTSTRTLQTQHKIK